MSAYRTYTCGQLRAGDAGGEARLCGWVNARRDHGGLIFIDLRDHTGLVQIVFEPAECQAFEAAEQLRPEHVLSVAGKVRRRPGDTANPNLPTGDIEVYATGLLLLNRASDLPFYPEDAEVTEETKLRHRVVHLRSSAMQRNLRLRHRMAANVRTALDQAGFIEVETPSLTCSTPEGARDFLVPSRSQRQQFYALPQSPQLFKQMLIAGGIDRYYQFPRCFRDEDLRADRQPEFTQIDIEMAFAAERDVMQVAEQVVRAAWQAADAELDAIPQLSYADALRDYGCDNPDLSIELKLCDVLDLMRGCDFQVFAAAAAKPGSRIAALCVPSDGLSRKHIDELTDFARSLGARGLAYIKIDRAGAGTQGVTSPIAKFLSDEIVNATVQRCQASAGDIIFFGADAAEVVNGYMAPLRVELGRRLGLVRSGRWPTWIVDFPLFAKDPERGKLAAVHHPFTAPAEGDVDKLLAGEDLLELKSRAYDLVLNGQELGGGSVRIHNPAAQLAALAALDIDRDTAFEQFGFLLTALSQGAPPHGGIAFGFDRMAALLAGADSIRDVIAFPKTQSGACPFTGAPTPVSRLQLAELGLAAGKSQGAGSA